MFRGRALLLAALWLAYGLVPIEGALRLQQYLGPIYDLEFTDLGYLPAEDLNHRPAANKQWRMLDPFVYRGHFGHSYTHRYDDDGVRIDPYREVGDQPLRILFLGDSFMQGYDDSNTIPAHVWRILKSAPAFGARPLQLLNVGLASYSPVIYIAQAKLLIPKLRPQLVVVDIDETDLGDDSLRYRELVERDADGKIVAVRSTAALRDFNERYRTLRTQAHPLYLARMAARLRLGGWRMSPRGRDGTTTDTLLLNRCTAQEAHERYPAELSFFRSTVGELLDTLIALQGGRERVLIIHHPHLSQLQLAADGHSSNHLVGDVIAAETSRRGIPYYDATEDMRRLAGGDPQRLYWVADMHLNFDGLRMYGELVGQRIERLLANP